MRLIHYSSDKITLENRIYDQKDNDWHAKPSGLWFSVESENFPKHNYNWKKWCEVEKFRLENLRCVYEICLSTSSNILILKTANQIFEMAKKYPYSREIWDTAELDWFKIKQEYSGIIIAPYQWDARLSMRSTWYYGWDCSSGCIWDTSVIEKFELLEEGILHETEQRLEKV